MKAKSPRKAKATAPKTAAAKVAAKKKPATKLLQLIVQALDDKKAEDLRVLEVGSLSSITDFLVLATGNSEPHLRALRIEVERVLDEQKAKILGVDTTKASGWTVIDAFEIMIHLFTPENRDKYRIEQLWKDAVDVKVEVAPKKSARGV